MGISIKKSDFYRAIFMLIVVCDLYVGSFKLNIFLQLGVLVACHVLEPVAFSKRISRHMAGLLLLLLIGFIGTIIHFHSLSAIFKDLFHFIKPLLGLVLGYTLFRRMGDIMMFARTIVITAVFTAMIHLLIILLLTDFMSGRIEIIRLYTKDNFLEVIALFVLIWYPKFEGRELFVKKPYKWIFAVILLFSSFLYFSRTMIIIAGIVWLTIKGYTKITAKGLRAIAVVITAISLFYVYLYNANIRRGTQGLEGFLYKIKIVPEEIFTFNIDRHNHADLWDHWRGYEAKRAFDLMKQYPSSYIIGTGHGSLVDLKFYAPLTGDRKGIRYISELHNGYVYIFYKTGITGLLIYLFILLRWYAYVYKRHDLSTILISAGGFIFLLSSIMITGIYNSKDII
uniref:O-antigen ligase family protein n=1 Tax=uncultured Flavobacterium sp. TaxID=165435 RepID=UPI0025F05F4E